jgi:hypothetical protein
VINSRKIKWVRHVARLGERRDLYRVLLGKPEGKRPLGRPRLRRDDNNKMEFQEVRCGDLDWIKLADACECGNELWGTTNRVEFFD